MSKHSIKWNGGDPVVICDGEVVLALPDELFTETRRRAREEMQAQCDAALARVKELEAALADAEFRALLSPEMESANRLLQAANADRDAWKAAAHDTHERERRWQSMAEIANADRARLRAASRDLYHALKRVGLGFGEYEYPGTVCTVCGTERNTMGPVGSSALGAHPHKLDCLIVTCEAALAESEKLP